MSYEHDCDCDYYRCHLDDYDSDCLKSGHVHGRDSDHESGVLGWNQARDDDYGYVRDGAPE